MSHFKDILPEQVNIRSYFNVQRFSFARIGINAISLERTLFSYFWSWFPTSSQALLCFATLIYAVNNIHDLDVVTDTLSPFWQGFMSLFKFFHFMWHRKKIVRLIRKLWLWNLEAKSRELEILSCENRKDIIFCNFYHLAVVMAGFLAFLAPLAIVGFYAWKGENFWNYLQTPVKAYYVIDINSPLNFGFIYLWNTFAIYFVIYISVAIDSLFSWFMWNIVAQFRILKLRFYLAGQEQSGYTSLKSIYDCLLYYGRCLKLAKDFNETFSGVIFIKFTISCIQICCLAFQFSRGGELMDQAYRGLFLLAVSMQLILYCYGGQRILDESDSITNAIYKSFHWESLSKSNKKLLLFSMLRSQKPCQVSGIFFTANLSLFLWVYRTAASFITMLWTLEEKEVERQ
ncbi:odorant receptor 45a-like [Cochliomyia hominivorax]